MTLKQFLEVAAGVGVALLIYSLPLLNIIKWPLMFISGALGAAFAFLPIQNRPLGFWMGAFLRSIYSPTIFSWENKTYDFFTNDSAAATAQSPTATTPQALNAPPKDNGPTEGNIPKPEFMDTLENTEKEFLSRIQNMFARMPALPKNTPATTASAPKEEVHVVAQTIEPVVASETIISNDAKDYLLNKPNQQTPNKPIEEKTQISIPQTPTVSFQKTPETKTISQNIYQATQPTDIIPAQITPQTPTVNTNQAPSAATNSFLNSTSNPPMMPEKPNIIVGQIIGKDNQIVESAIIDIIDNTGRPVRALRSNKAGHFMIVTPLQNGTYTLNIEKEGYNFKPVSIITNGNIIPPILIKE